MSDPRCGGGWWSACLRYRPISIIRIRQNAISSASMPTILFGNRLPRASLYFFGLEINEAIFAANIFKRAIR